MSKIIRIDNCSECHYSLPSKKLKGKDYCSLANKYYTFIVFIPDWCPLPDWCSLKDED